jgi:hypothetical protein
MVPRDTYVCYYRKLTNKTVEGGREKSWVVKQLEGQTVIIWEATYTYQCCIHQFIEVYVVIFKVPKGVHRRFDY